MSCWATMPRTVNPVLTIDMDGEREGRELHASQRNDEDVREILLAASQPHMRATDVGPLLLNGDGDAEGILWREMTRWMYDVGVRSFPWHLTWKQQPQHLKVEFWLHCSALVA